MEKNKDIVKLAELLNKYVPERYSGICTMLLGVKHEVNEAIEALKDENQIAMEKNDFVKMRELVDVMELLASKVEYMEMLTDNFKNVGSLHEAKDETTAALKPAIDYGKYAMDDTVPYLIAMAPTTHHKPAAIQIGNHRIKADTWKDTYVLVCSYLYKKDPSVINKLVGKRGAVKVSSVADALRTPVKISGSNLWLETNDSAAQIKNAMILLFNKYNISLKDVSLYFRRDYTELHNG